MRWVSITEITIKKVCLNYLVHESHIYHMEIWFKKIERVGGSANTNIQLSGGKPTLEQKCVWTVQTI